MDTRALSLIIGVPLVVVLLIMLAVTRNKKDLEAAGIPTKGAIAADQGDSGGDNNALSQFGPVQGGGEQPDLPADVDRAADALDDPMAPMTPLVPIPAGTIGLLAVRTLGLPGDTPLPPPTQDLAAVRLDPEGVYQIEMGIGAAAGTTPPPVTWSFEIQGGEISDIILESYPPQLGNPRGSLTNSAGSVALEVDDEREEPVFLTVRAQGGGRTWEKVLLLATDDYELDPEDYVEGTVLIGLASGVTGADDRVNEMLRTHELQLKSSLMDGTVIEAMDGRTRGEPKRTPLELHAELIWEPIVRYAEPNYIARVQSGAVETPGQQ
ncbi:MAG TPA: hypothetical protein VEI97_19930 [bacterium]|nr:hypothetical protein [bacterium]